MYLLGVDTGGTYTDAVVVSATSGDVVATAKAPTTHGGLAVGIGEAIAGVVGAEVTATDISLVSLSTTLATNALVEDLTRPAGLVLVGFEPDAVQRGGLVGALGDAPVVTLAGGHTSHGDEAQPLDLLTLEPWLEAVGADVEALAVAAAFSVRNPSHELAVREAIIDATGLPVTCSHELSAALNGPKRAVTALLNARLVSMIAELLDAAEHELASAHISAPVMVVRGNGSLIAADVVRHHPIETILSGPAASLVGAAHLIDEPDAVVIDVGGTTTDIAVVRDGELDVSPDGAVVGGHQTMVEAVAMATHGLGGDSHVRLAPRASGPELLIGPRRVTPLARAAPRLPGLADALARQLANDTPGEFDGLFVEPAPSSAATSVLSDPEQRIVERVGLMAPVAEIVRSRIDVRTVDQLVTRGVLSRIGFTPTDAAHVVGAHTDHDVEAATLGAGLLARSRDRLGRPVAASAQRISEIVVEAFIERSAEAALASAFGSDGLAADLASSPLVAAARSGDASVARIDIGLSVPVVGVGAPATTYHPRVASLLGTRAVVAPHAEVANAVGAAVGRIRTVEAILVSAPRRGVFRVHTGTEPIACYDLDEARVLATETATERARDAADRAGAADVTVRVRWDERSATVEDRPYFVEGTLTATAVGPPELA